MRQTEAESVPAEPETVGPKTGEPGRWPRPWQAAALQVLGVWVVVSPYLLHGVRDTPSVLSGTLSGVLLLLTGAWARSARIRWNSVGAGLVALTVVGSVLARLRRRFV